MPVAIKEDRGFMSNSKNSRQEQNIDELESLEIIELAGEELETLARAFEVIAEVCDERYSDKQEPVVETGLPHYLVH